MIRADVANIHKRRRRIFSPPYLQPIDPSYIIAHRITLDQSPEMYKVWRDKKQSVTKIVIDPWAA